MTITRITEQNYDAFAGALPQYGKRQPAYLMGCIVDDTAVGTVALDITKECCSISWLWVEPEYYGKGVGGALLNAACDLFISMASERLTITYPVDAPWTEILDYMLWMRGFSVSARTYPAYFYTKAQLLEARFMKREQRAPGVQIVPFSQLTQKQLQSVIAENRNISNYYVTHADYERIDNERSTAAIMDGRICGMVLVSTFGEESQLSLDLLYLRSTDYKLALALMQETARLAIGHPAGLQTFRFICTEDAAVKLCRYLLGEQESVPVEYCHGELYADSYLERRGGHV